MGSLAPTDPVTPHRWTGTVDPEMSTDPTPVSGNENLELPVDELLRRARPLPPLSETVIDDLSEEEAEAFFTAITS